MKIHRWQVTISLKGWPIFQTPCLRNGLSLEIQKWSQWLKNKFSWNWLYKPECQGDYLSRVRQSSDGNTQVFSYISVPILREWKSWVVWYRLVYMHSEERWRSFDREFIQTRKTFPSLDYLTPQNYHLANLVGIVIRQ